MMRRAGELRQNQTEAEATLWSHLRAHRMAGVQFRRHTAPACGAGDTPLAITSWTFVHPAEKCY
ncbi:MAG TPA: DUF559 domain-containing protein [Anaerolineales bacterium]|nr:DUF559 domain-containing protein [Anaerolineales bacterium]